MVLERPMADVWDACIICADSVIRRRKLLYTYYVGVLVHPRSPLLGRYILCFQ